MKRNIKVKFILFLVSSLILLSGCESVDVLHEYTNIDEISSQEIDGLVEENEFDLDPDGYYTDLENVSLYIKSYNKLPNNYITKKEARELGWDSKEGNLWEVTDKKSIGGDRFGNREGKLPELDGRKYYECDINYNGGFRGPERLVYSNDGLIYYTSDHYKTFELIFGDELL